MVRSSSPFEWDINGGKLSWVYKSLFVKDTSGIVSGIEEIIDHNRRDYIQDLHKNIWHTQHPLIPIIIQPYIPGIYAGVISKNGNDIFVDISVWNNHTITQWTSTEHIHYEWKIGKNRELITHIKSTNFVLKGILNPIEKCISFYTEKDWIIEFTYTEKWFILLQLKTYEKSHLEKIEEKYQSNFFLMMHVFWYQKSCIPCDILRMNFPYNKMTTLHSIHIYESIAEAMKD